MRIAITEKNASGDCQPLRLAEAIVCPAILNSTPYHLKKLKISRTTPEMPIVISPGVSFFRSKGASVRASCPANGHTALKPTMNQHGFQGSSTTVRGRTLR